MKSSMSNVHCIGLPRPQLNDEDETYHPATTG